MVVGTQLLFCQNDMQMEHKGKLFIAGDQLNHEQPDNSNLALTRTLDFLHTFTVILPSVTRASR